MRVADVARYLSVSRRQVYTLRKDHGFPEPRALGVGVPAWRRADVDAWVDSRPAYTPKPRNNRSA